MTTINGFTMPHKIEWHDISKLKHYLHQRITSGELSYGESNVTGKNPDIYQHCKYFWNRLKYFILEIFGDIIIWPKIA
jgi:hypothetical protein